MEKWLSTWPVFCRYFCGTELKCEELRKKILKCPPSSCSRRRKKETSHINLWSKAFFSSWHRQNTAFIVSYLFIKRDNQKMIYAMVSTKALQVRCWSKIRDARFRTTSLRTLQSHQFPAEVKIYECGPRELLMCLL